MPCDACAAPAQCPRGQRPGAKVLELCLCRDAPPGEASWPVLHRRALRPADWELARLGPPQVPRSEQLCRPQVTHLHMGALWHSATGVRRLAPGSVSAAGSLRHSL